MVVDSDVVKLMVTVPSQRTVAVGATVIVGAVESTQRLRRPCPWLVTHTVPLRAATLEGCAVIAAVGV